MRALLKPIYVIANKWPDSELKYVIQHICLSGILEPRLITELFWFIKLNQDDRMDELVKSGIVPDE